MSTKSAGGKLRLSHHLHSDLSYLVAGSLCLDGKRPGFLDFWQGYRLYVQQLFEIIEFKIIELLWYEFCHDLFKIYNKLINRTRHILRRRRGWRPCIRTDRRKLRLGVGVGTAGIYGTRRHVYITSIKIYGIF